MIINGDLESAQLERFTTVNLPNPATHKGRLVYDTTIDTALFSNGTIWVSLKAVSSSFAENVTTLPLPILADKGRLVYLTTDASVYYNSDGSNYYKLLKEQDFVDTSKVGDVKHSMLTEAQFNAQVGFGGALWVLADGRSVTGSAFSTITGFSTVPDMRGKFLRGKNNGVIALGNPDGDLALGAFTDDKYESHNHGVSWGTSYSPVTDNSTNKISSGNVPTGYNFSQSTSSSGANETAPKSITVNIFIRIE